MILEVRYDLIGDLDLDVQTGSESSSDLPVKTRTGSDMNNCYRKGIECCNFSIAEDPGWPIPFRNSLKIDNILKSYY